MTKTRPTGDDGQAEGFAQGALSYKDALGALVLGPAVGLMNLGNTCFFNSAIQLLLACPQLNEAATPSRLSVAGQACSPGSAGGGSIRPASLGRGPLGFALQQAFLNVNGSHARRSGGVVETAAQQPHQLHGHHHHNHHHHHQHGGGGGGGSNGSYNPQALLAAVCRVAPQFKGRQQHDSHELMRLLLDGLHEEEKRAADMSRRRPGRDSDASPPPTPSPALLPASPPPPSSPSSMAANGASATAVSSPATPCGSADGESSPGSADSVIARLFGGELVSCIRCGTCGAASHSPESFYDLSLPIPDELTAVDERELKAAAAGSAAEAGIEAAGGKAGKAAGRKLSKKEQRQLDRRQKAAAVAATKAVGAQKAKGKGAGKGAKPGPADPDPEAEAEAAVTKEAREQGQGVIADTGGRGGKKAGGKKGGGGKARAEADEEPAAALAVSAAAVDGSQKVNQKQLRKLAKEQRKVKIAEQRQAKKAGRAAADAGAGQGEDKEAELKEKEGEEAGSGGESGAELEADGKEAKVVAGGGGAASAAAEPVISEAWTALSFGQRAVDEKPTATATVTGELAQPAAAAAAVQRGAEAVGLFAPAGTSEGTAEVGTEREGGDGPAGCADGGAVAALVATASAAIANGAAADGISAAADTPDSSSSRNTTRDTFADTVDSHLADTAATPPPAGANSSSSVLRPVEAAGAAVTAVGADVDAPTSDTAAPSSAPSQNATPLPHAHPQPQALPTPEPPRPRVLDVGACLAAFFGGETVAWTCPRERSEAMEAAAAASAAPFFGGSLAATPLTPPLRKQVSWSPGAPEVFLVPGSAEQRGTDLEEAMRGNAPFFRPARAHGAPFVIQAQLDPFETDHMHLQLVPLAGSGRAAALLTAAAAAAPASSPAAAIATSPIPAAPMSPVLSTILGSSPRSSSGGGSGSPRGATASGASSERSWRTPPPAAAAPGPAPFSDQGLPLGCLDVALAWRSGGESSQAQSRRVRAAAQLLMDCAADLMAAPTGLQHLLDMLAGGIELAEAPSSPPPPSAGAKMIRSCGSSSGKVRFLLRGKCRSGQTAPAVTPAVAAAAENESSAHGGGTGAGGGGVSAPAETSAEASSTLPSASASAAMPISRIGSGVRGSTVRRHEAGAGSEAWEYPTALRRPAKHPAFAHLARRPSAGALTPPDRSPAASSSSSSGSSSSVSSSESSSFSPSPDMSPSPGNSDAEAADGCTSSRRQPRRRSPPDAVSLTAAAVAAAACATAAAAPSFASIAESEGLGCSGARKPAEETSASPAAAAAAAAAAIAADGSRGGAATYAGPDSVSTRAALQNMHGVNLDPALHPHHQHHHRSHHNHHSHQHQHWQQEACGGPREGDGGTDSTAAGGDVAALKTRATAPSGGADGDQLFEIDDLTSPRAFTAGPASPDFVQHRSGQSSTPGKSAPATMTSMTAGVLHLLSPPPRELSPVPAAADTATPSTAAEPVDASRIIAAATGPVAVAGPGASNAIASAIYTAAAADLDSAQTPPPGQVHVDSHADSRRGYKPDGGGSPVSRDTTTEGGSGSESPEAPVAAASAAAAAAAAAATAQPIHIPSSGVGEAYHLLIPSAHMDPSAAAAGGDRAGPVPMPSPAAEAAANAATAVTPDGRLRRSSSGGLRRSGGGSSGNFQRASTKQYYLRRPPEVLVLHLKRFQMDARGRLTKIDKHVVFETTLDLGPYVAGAAAAAASAASAAVSIIAEPATGSVAIDIASADGVALPDLAPAGRHHDQQHQDLPELQGGRKEAAQSAQHQPLSAAAATSPQRAPPPQAQSQPSRSALAAAVAAAATQKQQQQQQFGAAAVAQLPYLYDLLGVVEHSGEMRCGHYVAYVKRLDPAAGGGGGAAQWYYVSDTRVRPVAEAAVLRAQAYILLYTRRQLPPPPSPPHQHPQEEAQEQQQRQQQ